MPCSESGKVLFGLLGSRAHGVGARGPAGRADLVWVLLHILHSLQDAQSLLHIAAERQVVDGGVLNDALRASQVRSVLLCICTHEADIVV